MRKKKKKKKKLKVKALDQCCLSIKNWPILPSNERTNCIQDVLTINRLLYI
jgi:hypothetical protein